MPQEQQQRRLSVPVLHGLTQPVPLQCWHVSVDAQELELELVVTEPEYLYHQQFRLDNVQSVIEYLF